MKLYIVSLLVLICLGCASAPTDSSELVTSEGVENPTLGVDQKNAPALKEAEVDFLEISVAAEVNDMVLDGMLTLPSKGEKFPTVILVHGSGPNDKDSTIFENTPFKDIAHGLASLGVATYRYDKGAFAYPMRFATNLNLTLYEETVNDAVAITQMVQALPEVDSERVFVLGHSLGGHSIPRIAEQANAAGYIIMAGNVRSLSELVLEQIPYLLDQDGVRSPEEVAYLDMVKAEFAKLADPATIPQDQPVFGAYKTYWIDLESYKPLEVAQTITEPVLVLQGERDYQVTMQDFTLWQDAFGGSDNWQFISYPDLNHLMISGTGPSYPTEYMVPGNVSLNVIEDIAGWIGEQD